MKGLYPTGFAAWEIEAIEQFRDTDPELYEWRKTAHLIPENLCRPIGRAIPVVGGVGGAGAKSACDPAKSLSFVTPGLTRGPAFAGGEELSGTPGQARGDGQGGGR